MSLRFIYGRAGSGKSHYCFENMKRILEKETNEKLILIVPEQFSFQAQKNLLNQLGEKAILNCEVLDFKRMAYKAFNEVGGITKEHMNPSGKAMLLYHILEQNKEEFKVFTTAAKQQGFIKTISNTISELKKYNITPEVLKDTIDNIEDNSILSDKLQDIQLVYNKFEELLHVNYIDSEDDLTLLSKKIDDFCMIKKAHVFLDEFSNFTPQQYNIIEKLLKYARKVNITLNSDYYENDNEATNVFSVTKNTEDRLLKLAKDNNIQLDKPIILNKKQNYRFKNNKELAHLESEYVSYPYKKYEQNTETIKLFRASNTYSEIENTARDIVRLCREKNIKFNKIAVVARDLTMYDNIIKSVFNEYEIPYFIDEKKEIEGNLIIVLISSVLEIITKNWSYQSVFRYLKTELTDVEKEDVDLIENYVLEWGIKGKKKWTSKEEWHYRPNKDLKGEITKEENELLQHINDIRNKIVTPIINLYSVLKRKSTVTETCTALFDFLEKINVAVKIEQWIENFKESGNQEKANEYGQIWNIIIEVLDQMVEVLGNEILNLQQFIKIMNIGFEEHKMGLIPPSLDQVLVGTVDRLKSHDVSVLYVVGVNDGIFPKASDVEGILNDADRAFLKNMGVELARDTRTIALEEQYLIYSTLTTASNYLRISFPISDLEGKTLRPSIIISRLKSIFPKVLEESDVVEECSDNEMLKNISSTVPTFNKLVTMIRRMVDGEKCSEIWKDVYRWYSSRKEWKNDCERLFSGIEYTNLVNKVNESKIRKLYSDNQYSVSRLEKYTQCPFSYFVQYGLRCKERKIYEITAPDLGSFVHEIIYEFSEEVVKNNKEWNDITEEWCEDRVNKIADQIIEKEGAAIFKSSPRYEYLTLRLKKMLKRTMKIIVEQIKRSGFNPVGFEQEFKEGKVYPPMIVELSTGEKINIIGKIDRIDMMKKDGETYIRIIDYKTGNKILNLSDVYYGLQIQLLLYLDAILTYEEGKYGKEGIPAAVLYLKIDDPIIKSKKMLSDEEIQEEIMKNLKMKGLFLDNPQIIKEMDKNMELKSSIISAELKKDGSLSSRTLSANGRQFKLLREHVRKNLAKCCEQMMQGDISIKPYNKNKEVPCDYCLYSSICQFDTTIDGNNYKFIHDKKKDEVWKLLEQEERGEN